MRTKQNGFSLLRVCFGIFTILISGMFLFFQVMSPSIIKAQDSQRMLSIKTLSTSLKAQSLGKETQNKFFFATHLDLLRALREGAFPIPESTNDLCYYIGMTTPQAGTESAFLILSWGDTTSTLSPNNPGILFQSNNQEAIKQTILKLSPTINRDHFTCNATNIPWKENMSSLLSLQLTPNHWLKINEHQQICMAQSGLKGTDKLVDCVPL